MTLTWGNSTKYVCRRPRANSAMFLAPRSPESEEPRTNCHRKYRFRPRWAGSIACQGKTQSGDDGPIARLGVPFGVLVMCSYSHCYTNLFCMMCAVQCTANSADRRARGTTGPAKGGYNPLPGPFGAAAGEAPHRRAISRQRLVDLYSDLRHQPGGRGQPVPRIEWGCGEKLVLRFALFHGIVCLTDGHVGWGWPLQLNSLGGAIWCEMHGSASRHSEARDEGR